MGRGRQWWRWLYEICKTEEVAYQRQLRVVELTKSLFHGSKWDQSDIDDVIAYAANYIMRDDDPRRHKYGRFAR